MSGATLQEAKLHLRVDGAEDDTLIASCLETALAYLGSIDVDVSATTLPRPVVAAQLLLATRLYERRDGGMANQPDDMLAALIAPYRRQAA